MGSVRSVRDYHPYQLERMNKSQNKTQDSEAIDRIVVMSQHHSSPWEGVVSGTTSAILANTIVYPLDMYGDEQFK